MPSQRLAFFLAGAAFVAGSALTRPAAAQVAEPAFALDRYNPAERGSEWFVLDSLDMRGAVRPAVGVTVDYAWRPETYRNGDGSRWTRAVRNQAFSHVGASVVFFQRFRLGVSVPVAFVNEGLSGTIDGRYFASPRNKGGFGDIRAGADLSLFGTYGGPLTVAVGGQVFLPTGDQASYLSDGTVRGMPRLSLAGDVGPFVYAAMGGVHFRPHTGAPFGGVAGAELVFAASAGARVARGRLVVGPELFGSTALENVAEASTPLEAMLGAHYTFAGGVRAGLGVGTAIEARWGAPPLRLLGSVEWSPEPAAARGPDRDGDDVPDAEDACPDQVGVRTEQPSTNGCPALVRTPAMSDRDFDGVPDGADACPEQAGVPTADPRTNGCPPPPPPPDSDRDGVPDSLDACPHNAGVATDDPKTNGCLPPPKDSDGDGIPDDVDACADQAGPANPDPMKNGCPIARVVGGAIEINEQIHFKTGNAQILAESESVLQAVLDVLRGHPEIERVRIDGHTDNAGIAAMNQALSARRAAAVKAWLMKNGIPDERLESAGRGDTKPMQPNDTAAGRAANRRVEFHIESK
jgi:OmpA-OmpF porin, OOP family